jgi:hypothetical protein
VLLKNPPPPPVPWESFKWPAALDDEAGLVVPTVCETVTSGWLEVDVKVTTFPFEDDSRVVVTGGGVLVELVNETTSRIKLRLRTKQRA